jgi:hypothetical protein
MKSPTLQGVEVSYVLCVWRGIKVRYKRQTTVNVQYCTNTYRVKEREYILWTDVAERDFAWKPKTVPQKHL